jgi:murein DD-endopeptidase MepM/ murein hydrolase activator NlpD
MRNLLFIICIISFLFSATITVKQGDCFTVTASSRIVPHLEFRGAVLPLYAVTRNVYQSVVGISYDVPVGTYRLSVIGRPQKQYLIKVVSAKFPVSVLIVSEEKQKSGATDFDVLGYENSILGPLLRKQTPVRYWQGVFQKPVKSNPPITSVYGAQRSYRNSKGKEISQWAHRGTDYGVPVGTPVRSPNTGKVLLSRPFQVHGGTIVIDHGQGVLSVYNHLSKRLVVAGQRVTKGQLIGYSGNSGLTTGPHLHYGLSVNNVRVNPLQWFEKKF